MTLEGTRTSSTFATAYSSSIARVVALELLLTSEETRHFAEETAELLLVDPER